MKTPSSSGLLMSLKKSHIFMICSILLIIWFPLFQLFYTIPNMPAIRQGPSGDGFRTIGVFKPGGYIKFEFNPKIYSVSGYYRAKFVITPTLNDRQKTKEIVWSPLKDERNYGWPWRKKIRTKKNRKKVSFSFYIDIPQNKSLADEKILFNIDVSITYPDKVRNKLAFNNLHAVIKQNIEFEMSNDSSVGPKVSAWKAFWNKKTTGYETVLGGLWFLGILGVVYRVIVKYCV